MPKKILIIGPAWVGDMVMSQTLYTLLKQRELDCVIDVLAPAWCEPLLARMPEVRQSFVMPVGHGRFGLKQRWQIARKLKSEHYDQSIVLPNSWKSALIPLFAGIPKRTGWIGEARYGLLNDHRRLDKAKYPLMVQRFMALALPKAESLPSDLNIIPALQCSMDNVQRVAAEQHINFTDNKVLALCPGAKFGPSKCWPAEYFAQVANEKLSSGWQVVIFGAQDDAQTAAHIQAATENRCVNLAGKTSLSEAIDLLSQVTAVVSNDSGLMHIAAALNRKVIALYGSTSPSFTPPLNDSAKPLMIDSVDLPCRPCFKRECPLVHHKCMQDLKPQQVIRLLQDC